MARGGKHSTDLDHAGQSCLHESVVRNIAGGYISNFAHLIDAKTNEVVKSKYIKLN